MSPSSTGFGVAVFTMATSALFTSATTTVAVALLLVRLGTIFVDEAITVSAMFVPVGVFGATCSTRLKLAEALTARLLPSVQVITPTAPTAGVIQVQPAGG